MLDSVHLDRSATDSVVMRSLPAWALSGIVHLLGLIAFALLWQPARSTVMEPDRRVAIVVAQRLLDAEVTAGFQERAAAAAAPRQPQLGGQQGDEAIGEPLREALPTDEMIAMEPLADVALPAQPTAASGAAAQLIARPRLATAGRPSILPGQGDEAILAEEAARRPAVGPLGPAARISLFGGAPSEGRSFVFVIDRSQSMGGSGLGALDAAQRELSAALVHLRPSHRFEIVAYHHKPVYFAQRKLVPATAANTRDLVKFFGGLAAYGATDHRLALLGALGCQPDVIYLLTDGGDPHLNSAQLREMQQIAQRQGTSIHCVQFGFGPLQDEDPFLQRLAHANGGGYRYVDMAR